MKLTKSLRQTLFVRQISYIHFKYCSYEMKNGQIQVCVDFRDINNACPKDEFPLPILELMIDTTVGYKAMSFMDGFFGYNEIRMEPKDEELTAFAR